MLCLVALFLYGIVLVRFAHSTPTRRLPVSGQVSRLVAAHFGAAGDFWSGVVRVHPVSGSRPVREKIWTKQENSNSFSFTCVWKRLRQDGFFRNFHA